MVLYGIKNEIARCVCRGRTEKRRDGRKATQTGGADKFSPLSSLLFCPGAIIFLNGQRRSIVKRKEHLATSYGGTGNHRVLIFIGSPVIHDAIFATSAQFMR